MIAKYSTIYLLFAFFSSSLYYLVRKGHSVGGLIDCHNFNFLVFGLLGGAVLVLFPFFVDKVNKKSSLLWTFGAAGGSLGILFFFCNRIPLWPILVTFVITGFFCGIAFYYVWGLSKRIIKDNRKWRYLVQYFCLCVFFVILFDFGMLIHYPIYLILKIIFY